MNKEIWNQSIAANPFPTFNSKNNFKQKYPREDIYFQSTICLLSPQVTCKTSPNTHFKSHKLIQLLRTSLLKATVKAFLFSKCVFPFLQSSQTPEVAWYQLASGFGYWQETLAFAFQSTDLGVQNGIAAWI